MRHFVATRNGASALSDAGGEPWTNITNVLALDGAYADCDIPKNDVTQWAKAYGYAFDIPVDATINGIEMKITRYGQNSSDISDGQVYLMDAALNSKGSNYGTGTGWATSAETVAYGGAADLWGTTWSAEDINQTNFGIMYEVSNSNGSARQAYIDNMEITIYYSRPDETPIFLALGAF